MPDAPATPPDRIEVFAERRLTTLLAWGKLGLGAILLCAMLYGLAIGTAAGQTVLPVGGAALVLLGFGVFDLMRLANPAPEIRMTPEGVSLRHHHHDLVPWTAVTRTEIVKIVGASAMVRFHVDGPGQKPRVLTVDLGPMQGAMPAILSGLDRFAPQVPILNRPARP